MKHKMLKFLVSAIVVCTLLGCSEKVNTDGWPVIWLDELYSFSVPSDWVLTKIDGKMIFSDRGLDQSDVTIHMMEVDIHQNSPTEDMIFSGPMFYGERVKKIDSEMNSNGTFYDIYTVKIEDHIEKYRFLIINLRHGRIVFVAVDPEVKTSVLKTILTTKGMK